MKVPSDRAIRVGCPHCTRCDVEMLVYDYESGIETVVLVAGSIFQPWEPHDHWRGQKIPITLGDRAEEFDWGVTSADGHFLRWDDFFSKCEPLDEEHRDEGSSDCQ